MKKLLATVILITILLSTVLLALPVQATESDGLVRYGYTTITEPNVKYVYEQIRDAMLLPEPPESIALDQDKKVKVDELKKAYMLFVSDYPECFWLYNSYNYSHIENDIMYIYPKYSFVGEELVKAKIALEAEVSGIMRELPDTDNYGKALYLHDALAKHVSYEFVGEHQTAYGALVAGKAVCAGYTSAYQLLLNRAGIQAWSVSGDASQNGEAPIGHAWNVVWIEDGVCVYTDVTWDDGDSNLFHYYFNTTKEIMSTDHMVSAEIYTLPDCNHSGKSYFDINDRTVQDSTTMQELATLFGDAKNGERDAVLCYSGSDIEGFLNNIKDNQTELYTALGCLAGSRGYQLTRIANEIQISVKGNFAPATYLVKVEHTDTVKSYDGNEQYVKIGEAMKPQRFFAAEGYYFPENYTAGSVNGVSITRVTSREISVFGTPSADATLTLPNAAATEKEKTPEAKLSANGSGGMTLSGVENGMKYSFDAVNWVDITSSENIEFKDITAKTLYVIKKGNCEDTDDSDIQAIAVPELVRPTETAPSGNSSDTDFKQNESDNSGNSSFQGSLFGCKMSVVGGALVLVVSIAACGAVCRKKH